MQSKIKTKYYFRFDEKSMLLPKNTTFKDPHLKKIKRELSLKCYDKELYFKHLHKRFSVIFRFRQFSAGATTH